MKISDLFRPVEKPEELRTLSGQLVHEIHEATKKYGYTALEKLVRLVVSDPVPLQFTVSPRVENRQMIVTIPGSEEGRLSFWCMPLEETPGFEQAHVLWNREVTLASVEAALRGLPANIAVSTDALLSVSDPEAEFIVDPGEDSDRDVASQASHYMATLEYLDRRREIAKKVLEEAGIPLDAPSTVPWVRAEELRNRIDAELRRRAH